jgi:hypothetical protein
MKFRFKFPGLCSEINFEFLDKISIIIFCTPKEKSWIRAIYYMKNKNQF